MKSEMKLDVVLPVPVFLREPRGLPVVMLPPVYFGQETPR